MKYASRISASLLLCAWSSVVSAEAGWLPASKVKTLTVSHFGRYLVELSTATESRVCSQANQFFIDFDATGAESAYRMLLEASLAERRVQLYVTGRCALKGVAEFSSVKLVLD